MSMLTIRIKVTPTFKPNACCPECLGWRTFLSEWREYHFVDEYWGRCIYQISWFTNVSLAFVCTSSSTSATGCWVTSSTPSSHQQVSIYAHWAISIDFLYQGAQCTMVIAIPHIWTMPFGIISHWIMLGCLTLRGTISQHHIHCNLKDS